MKIVFIFVINCENIDCALSPLSLIFLSQRVTGWVWQACASQDGSLYSSPKSAFPSEWSLWPILDGIHMESFLDSIDIVVQNLDYFIIRGERTQWTSFFIILFYCTNCLHLQTQNYSMQALDRIKSIKRWNLQDWKKSSVECCIIPAAANEPRHQKTCLRGWRPGETYTSLLS